MRAVRTRQGAAVVLNAAARDPDAAGGRTLKQAPCNIQGASVRCRYASGYKDESVERKIPVEAEIPVDQQNSTSRQAGCGKAVLAFEDSRTKSAGCSGCQRGGVSRANAAGERF